MSKEMPIEASAFAIGVFSTYRYLPFLNFLLSLCFSKLIFFVHSPIESYFQFSFKFFKLLGAGINFWLIVCKLGDPDDRAAEYGVLIEGSKPNIDPLYRYKASQMIPGTITTLPPINAEVNASKGIHSKAAFIRHCFLTISSAQSLCFRDIPVMMGPRNVNPS